MQLTRLPPVTLADLVAVNEASANRTPGLHLTDIVLAIMEKLDPARYSKDYGDASENWQQAGFIWEDVLSRVFASRMDTDSATRFRPGELTKDGIIGSPDALCIEDDFPTPIVEEYKCTWKSSRDFDLYDKRYLWWLLQLQGYCHMVGTTRARIYVLHINGNYKGYIPETTAHLVEFSPIELMEQWASFLNTARSKGWL